MTRDLFNSEFSGTSEFHWWMGQIVDEKNWNENHAHKVHKRDEEKGWGYRYKVRIFGRDTKEKYQDTTDDELPMAEVLYPTTAGSGHDGSAQTANLRQGNYVIGFYKDGIDGTEPIIMGVLGNQSQTRLFGGDPDEGFIPRTGYIGLKETKTASTKNLVLEGPSQGTPPLEENPNPLVGRVAHVDQLKDGAYSHYVPKTRECDGPNGEMAGVQRALRNLLKLVNQIRSESSSFFGAASDLQNAIPSLIGTATAFISELLKTMIDKIRGYTNNIVDEGIKKIFNFVIPNQRAKFNRVVEQQQDGLQCLFNKLIAGLLDLVKGIVQGAVNKLIDAPMCAAEEMAGNVFSNLIGPITNKIRSAIRKIEAASGQKISVQGGPMDILNLIWGLLNFLTCDEKLDCTMNDQWSFWYGSKEKADEVRSNLGDLAQSINTGGGGGCDTNAKPCGPPRINFTGNGKGAAGNPVVSPSGSLLAVDMVSGGQGYTQPPSVTFMDHCGKGNGAKAIAVITPTGTTPRPSNETYTIPGYREAQVFPPEPAGNTDESDTPANTPGDANPQRPRTTGTGTGTPTTGTGTTTTGTGLGGLPGFTDQSSNGEIGSFVGSGIISDLNVFTTNDSESEEENTVVGVFIVDPGVAYLPAPDGDVGANGDVYATSVDTIVGNDIDGYNVLPPFETIAVLPGDTIAAPPGTQIEIYDNEGNITEIITGQGPLSPIPVTVGGSLTTPEYTDPPVSAGIGTTTIPPYPTSNGSYPVVLTIGQVVVTNPGVNYQPGDTISIVPDNGAILEPVFDSVGRVESVNVVNPGIGFTEWPNISIKSNQGINAILKPFFDIIRIGDVPEDDDRIPADVQLINVVDCVGKVTRDSRGNTIPNN
jgi:hypothetical protein